MRNELILYPDIFNGIIKDSLEHDDLKLSDSCFENLSKCLVLQRVIFFKICTLKFFFYR